MKRRGNCLVELSDDESDMEGVENSHDNSMAPWEQEFRRYLNVHTYPTWASLARDYLAIMGSSVNIIFRELPNSALEGEYETLENQEDEDAAVDHGILGNNSWDLLSSDEDI
ncbi:hypothetical protein K435DRAFT_794691 [Dendrothele bispora CBS 962.96]|uniref:HAT C-terminal dimerisation domain-containing protein n=1 Tax=Dendrothele bispora (strain CBS 962.96) TaxID=1314807 RepID=A0A4V4HGQ2_DENBC|nr:hypothetical protein K435DRAFT_794691 [Dendrothele bispora CBS 962.96]